MQIKLKDKLVGLDCEPYVIAEVASNHNGSLEEALRYIKALADLGADAVKFQLYTSENLLNPEVPDDKGQWNKHPAWDLINELSTPEGWVPTLKEACDQHGMAFTCTPFHLAAVDVLEKANIDFYKVGSGELAHPLLLQKIAATGKPVVLSTGMGDMTEVKKALKILKEGGCRDVVLLHCVSNYPPEDADTHLRVIPAMQEDLNQLIGFSDHSPGSALCLAAATLGACVFEKHVTFDRKLKGPDHGFALEMPEVKILVDDLKRVFMALGNNTKEAVANEAEMKIHARRGVYAKVDLKKGDLISEDKINIVRPLLPGQLSSAEALDILGSTIKEDVKANRPL